MTTTPDGLLLVDKPAGITSHDVVSIARRISGTRKVGHAGTLDPMATGLLVLGVGKATRLLTYLVGADKTYTATIRLGEATTTDDAEGEMLSADGATISAPEVESALAPLRGQIQQVPASVSAIKVDGKRAYARARAGEQVKLDPRPVTIHEFTVHSLTHAKSSAGVSVTDIEATVRCSSGTYIRALARDLGASLGVGGHLTALRRTVVGDFHIEDALPIGSRSDAAPALAQPFFLPLSQALQAAFPVRIASPEEERALSYGQKIRPNEDDGVVGVLTANGKALALVENRDGQGAPVLVFAPA